MTTNNNIQTILEHFAEEVIKNIQENMDKDENGRLGNSNLANSITYKIDNNRLIFYADYYWPYAEKGRGPTINKGNGFDFIDTLQNWIEKRQINLPGYFNSSRQFAGFLAKKISKEGSKLYRDDTPRDFIGDAVEENLDILQDKFTIKVIDNLNTQ